MHKFTLVLTGLLFAPVLMLVIMLWTVQYQLLNTGFIFGSLENAKVYDRIPQAVQDSFERTDASLSEDERIAYQKMAENVTPEFSREVINTNVENFVDYANGVTGKFELYLPLSKLGVPREQLPAELKDDKYDIEELSTGGNISAIQNSDDLLRPLWLGAIVLLAGLAVLYARFSKPWAHVYTLFLGSGISLIITSVIAQIFFINANRDLLDSAEPAQFMVGILFDSVLKDIAIGWLYWGIGLVMLGVVFLIIQKSINKKQVKPDQQEKSKPSHTV